MTLLTHLQQACEQLGLRLDPEYEVICTNGHRLNSLARIHDLGSENGMLIFTSFKDIKDHQACLKQAGYGYSVLSEPLQGEPLSIESYKEMFRDWGWAG